MAARISPLVRIAGAHPETIRSQQAVKAYEEAQAAKKAQQAAARGGLGRLKIAQKAAAPESGLNVPV